MAANHLRGEPGLCPFESRDAGFWGKRLRRNPQRDGRELGRGAILQDRSNTKRRCCGGERQDRCVGCDSRLLSVVDPPYTYTKASGQGILFLLRLFMRCRTLAGHVNTAEQQLHTKKGIAYEYTNASLPIPWQYRDLMDAMMAPAVLCKGASSAGQAVSSRPPSYGRSRYWSLGLNSKSCKGHVPVWLPITWCSFGESGSISALTIARKLPVMFFVQTSYTQSAMRQPAIGPLAPPARPQVLFECPRAPQKSPASSPIVACIQ